VRHTMGGIILVVLVGTTAGEIYAGDRRGGLTLNRSSFAQQHETLWVATATQVRSHRSNDYISYSPTRGPLRWYGTIGGLVIGGFTGLITGDVAARDFGHGHVSDFAYGAVFGGLFGFSNDTIRHTVPLRSRRTVAFGGALVQLILTWVLINMVVS